MMKRHTRVLFAMLSVLAASASISAQESTWAYDGFSGSAGLDLKDWSGGVGWASGWQDAGSGLPMILQGPSGSLLFGTLTTSPGAARAEGSPTLVTWYTRELPAVAGNLMYLAFLIRPEPDASGSQVVRLGAGPDEVQIGVFAGWATYGLFAGPAEIVDTHAPVTIGETALLVLEIAQEPAHNRTVYSLWVNPPPGGPRPDAPAASVVRPGLVAPGSQVSLRGQGGYSVDELRITSVWGGSGGIVPPGPPGGGCVRQWLPARNGFGTDWPVFTATAWDPDGFGPAPPALYIGGTFTQAGGWPIPYIASWDASSWSTLGIGDAGLDSWVYSLTPFPSAGLVAAGDFYSAGSEEGTQSLAAWDGGQWWSLEWEPAFGFASQVLQFDEDGDGPQSPRLMALAEGGNYVYAWDGSMWLGPTYPTNTIYAMAAHDSDGDGPGGAMLIAGGLGDYLQRWDGADWWAWVGPFTYLGGFGTEVNALTSWDPDGDSPANPLLVAGGIFDAAGGTPATSIAVWDGRAWSALGSGLTASVGPGHVYALTSFDPDGPGPLNPLLIAGGYFDGAGGVPASHIAAWDGESWSAMGGGMTGTSGMGWPWVVKTLTTYDPDGPGPRPPWLVAGGDFLFAGGRPSPYLALWGCCPADLSEDGMVDFSDYLEFLNLYELQDLRVDFNADGFVDFSDYLEFLNLYEEQC